MDTYQRILKLRDYIVANLDEDLELAQLSRQAHISRYHLHRLFSSAFGITLARFITRQRQRRAAYQLAFRPHLAITSIALAAGYKSPEAFSRAFHRLLGQSPSAFRQAPDWEHCEQFFRDHSADQAKGLHASLPDTRVEIVDFPQLEVARLDHVGPAHMLGETLRRFIQWRREQRLSPQRSRTFNLLFDDPATTDPGQFRFGLCAATDKPVSRNDAGIFADTIPAGRCARIRHTGPDAGLEPLVSFLYGRWLSGSGERLRDYPVFFERVSFFPDVPETHAVTDILLPLQ